MTTPLPTTFSASARIDYETPPGGITITGYIARRMHKTVLLNGLEELIISDSAAALVRFGVYAMAAATSRGPARYQPRFDGPGTTIESFDPETGAKVMVKQLSRSPHIRFSYQVDLQEGGTISGEEEITGTVIGLRGLGMPAPSTFDYVNADENYKAHASGTIHSELAFGIGSRKIRGYGELMLEDNQGNKATVVLNRKGKLVATATNSDNNTRTFHIQL